ncbi:RagB/SusD family nutrient uptake outer membrane protein [Mucilaginibacter sp. OK098]|uniref:RagB/SusD family nutrient uptake outer membrane protein n=1 Tax=Mucilaginibacter sp. OK098 TaxID=1855297 RepID=UPI00091F20DF|nr:RagB/SusD family nutrient uptake outer membrane protein [Mucilaginibacter sp. OK098]SHN28686.1 Starch-binding associating with outer membrane [Mucilaginibacter sp. OK098]
MKRNSLKILLVTATIGVGLISCNKNKILAPNYQVTSEKVYSTALGYKESLAKVYGSMALTGNQGPSGQGDVQGIDEGTSDFFRLLWYAQELPTDEAVIGWGDPGVPDFHAMSWSSGNVVMTGLYYRSMYQITLCNDFIRQSTDAEISKRGFSGADADNIRHYSAEARFLRAYQYSVMMDLFGNPPFVTDANAVGSIIPPQTDRKTLFNYIEGELKAIDPLLAKPKANEYGRADEAAAWALLARIYLNAKVYTGTDRYTDAITYAKKVIETGGYTLIDKYDNLMTADNENNSNEFILTINYNGAKTQGYGGTTFLTHAACGGSIPTTLFGVDSQWAGIRTTSSLVSLFPANTSDVFPNNGNPDTRAEFWTKGQNLAINDITSFNDGYAVTKFRNVNADGSAPSTTAFSDVDMPIFRLAEQYLIYAEAVTRGGTGGDAATALSYINTLRKRAYSGSTSGNITQGQLTTDFILDERARELFWEGFRRTDLIRYGKFTGGTYLWPFKGGVKNGTSVPDFRNLYAIPDQDRAVNPNLKQNAGY